MGVRTAWPAAPLFPVAWLTHGTVPLLLLLSRLCRAALPVRSLPCRWRLRVRLGAFVCLFVWRLELRPCPCHNLMRPVYHRLWQLVGQVCCRRLPLPLSVAAVVGSGCECYYWPLAFVLWLAVLVGVL